MFRSALVMVAAIAFATAGCGSTGGTNNNNGGNNDLATAPAPPDMAYDPGPYPTENIGTQEGDVLPFFTASGYRLSVDHTDVEELTYEELTIDILRGNPQCKCIFLVESATWCGPCNAEQPELIKAQAADPSFCIFDVLVDGPSRGVRPTQQDVADWGTNHKQNFPIVGSNKGTFLRLPRPDALPTNVTINPRTMQILAIHASADPAIIDNAKELCAQ